MSGWGVFAIVLGSLLLLGALAAAGWFGWHYLQRRILLRLAVRAEAVEAAAQALEDTFQRLDEASKDEMTQFKNNPDSPERRALHEVQSRAELLRDELDQMPLPRSLTPVAEALADAAFLVAREAGCVTDDDLGGVALKKLKSLDLKEVRGYVVQAHERVAATCAAFGLEDTAVYGGGLYL